MSLNIAIDYDDTFTADPAAIAALVNLMKGYGHHVMVVSCRRNTGDNVALIMDSLREHCCMMPIYLTGLGAKRPYMEERGVNVHIWIDDKPESVKEGR
jgi:hypothetical protein